jgi:hypothetical protein
LGGNQHFKINFVGGKTGGNLWDKICTEQGSIFLYTKSPPNLRFYLTINILTNKEFSASVYNYTKMVLKKLKNSSKSSHKLPQIYTTI